jgi:hypothetical protein
MHHLVHLLKAAGLQVHKTISLRQQRPFSEKTEEIERVLMKLIRIPGLLVCAHKELSVI